MKRILTIQDISCVGQCSLTVALPVVSACGVECAILPSSVLSNHTGGFKSWTFKDLTDQLQAVEKKWNEQDILFDAFYTGYVSPSHIEPILSIMQTCSSPGALRFVDPAMADNGVLYAGFENDFPAKMAKLVSVADYVLPNLTEAALLTGVEPDMNPDEGKVAMLIDRLHHLGAKNVVLTGVSFDKDLLGTAVSDGTRTVYDFNKRLSRLSHGTGDLFASVFAGAIMRGKSATESAMFAADIVCSAIEKTDESHWYGVSFEKVIPEICKGLPQ